MKKIILLCLIFCFSCENKEQNDKKFELIYQQYLEILDQNESIALHRRQIYQESGYEEYGQKMAYQKEEIEILKSSEYLILERKKFLKLFDLENPNFKLNEHFLLTYAQSVYDYANNYPLKDSINLNNSIKVSQKLWLEVKEQSNKRNIVLFLLSLADLEHSIVEKNSHRVGTFCKFYGTMPLYANKKAKIGKKCSILIGGVFFNAKILPKYLNKLKVKLSINGKKLETVFQKQILNDNCAICLTFVPKQAGNYEVSITDDSSSLSSFLRGSRSYKFVVGK